jgi:hypothetical protein
MQAFLIEAYLDAFRGLGAAVKLFWPILTLALALVTTPSTAGTFKFTANFAAAPFTTLAMIAGFVALASYVFIIFCQGAVGWHRRLLLHENPRWTSLVPARRSLQYAWPAFLFALITWICLMIVMAIVLPRLSARLTATIQDLNLGPNPTIEQLDAFRRAAMPSQFLILAITIVIVGAVLWVGREWLMIVPHVSARNDQSAWRVVKKSVKSPPGLFAALTVVMLLPSVLHSFYQSFVPMGLQLSPWFATSASIAGILLVISSFLCSLSVLSIAYRKAAADGPKHY